MDLDVLLKECQQLYQARFYTTNESGSTRTAVICYQEVLKQEQNHADARNGLETIENYYIRRANQDLARGKLGNVKIWLTGLKKVNPDSPTLAKLKVQYQSALDAR